MQFITYIYFTIMYVTIMYGYIRFQIAEQLFDYCTTAFNYPLNIQLSWSV